VNFYESRSTNSSQFPEVNDATYGIHYSNISCKIRRGDGRSHNKRTAQMSKPRVKLKCSVLIVCTCCTWKYLDEFNHVSLRKQKDKGSPIMFIMKITSIKP